MAEDRHGGGQTEPATGSPAGEQGGVEGAAAAVPAAGRAHRIWVRAILVLATVLAMMAIFAIWANRQLLNPDNWARTSTALLQKATIRSAVSAYLIDRLYASVNVEDELKTGLPKQLKPLAGPLSGALHSVAEQGAERALETPQVQGIWKNANRAADQTLVKIVEGGGSRVQINGGTVSLNLRQIVADLSNRLGLPSDLAEKLPPSVAMLRIVTSKELGLIRNSAKALHALALWLTILVMGLYALALYLADGHRRRTLIWVGMSLVLSGLVVLVGRKVAQGQVVSAITTDASIEPAANDAYSVATSLLVEVASAALIIGLAVVASAWFAGPARWAVAGRRFWAPHLREHPSLAYWITAGVLAVLFIWDPIPATGNPITMLLFTALAFFGAHILRAQIAREFPDATPVSVRAALREHALALRENISRALPTTSPFPPSKAGEIERLAALHERGAITDEEYAAAKRELLSGT